MIEKGHRASASSAAQKPRGRFVPVIGLLVGMTVGAGFGYTVGASATQSPLLREKLRVLSAFDLLALPLLFLLVLAVHEAGHLLGGFRHGMRFLLFIVGPFQWSRTPSGIRFSWIFNLGTLGGLAASTPNPDRPMKPQLLSLIAGGPIASLLLAIMGLAAVGLEGRIGTYGLILGALSLLIFLVTAIPLRAGGFMSDGMQFIEVIRGGPAVEERQALIVLMAQSLGGTRPRDLDGAVIRQALDFESAEPVRRVAARLYAYLVAVDSGSERAAEHAAWLAENIDGFPDGFRQSIAIELALHAATTGDLAGARDWLKRAKGGVVDASRRALAEAYVAILETDPERARTLLAQARKQLPRGMDPGLNVLTADQIERAAERVSLASPGL
jgi:hypothetical protein